MTAVKRLMAWHGMYYKIKPFHDNIDSIKGKQSLCKVLFNKKYTFLAIPYLPLQHSSIEKHDYTTSTPCALYIS